MLICIHSQFSRIRGQSMTSTNKVSVIIDEQQERNMKQVSIPSHGKALSESKFVGEKFLKIGVSCQLH